MDKQSELAIVRRAYAKQILAAAGVADARIERAYAAIPREGFLGPGPWQMCGWQGTYLTSPDADPIYVYVDQIVGLIPERRINNGQPSLHARLIAEAGIKEGEHIVHVGAGSGYYSAIMARLVGSGGRVTAIECDPVLAERARECLSGIPNVRVLEGDGSTTSLDVADVIYINAGVTHPEDAWLDALSDGGRLIIPLTTDENFPSPGSVFNPLKVMRSGVYFRIQRRGATFEARGLLPTSIIPAQGGRDPTAEAALAAAFTKGDWRKVTRLARNEDVSDEGCWFKSHGCCLTYD